MPMKTLPLDYLLSPAFMLKRIRAVQNGVHKHVRMFGSKSFKIYLVQTGSGFKPLARVDLEAEQAFINPFTADFGSDRIYIVGEESLTDSICFADEKRICLLVDMIDGTDLLERHFGNWCSAIVVFDPQAVEILASFVAVPASSGAQDGSMYYATREGAFKVSLKNRKILEPIPLTCSRPDKDLQDASVCLYAQKNNNFEALVALQRKRKFVSWLKQNRLAGRKQNPGQGELKFRFYDFAGNPMMVRMCDGTVDVVFDLNGQSPHDVVPGAYVALKAGAVMGTIEGKPLTEKQLAESLIRPGNSPLRYILAANQGMYEELSHLLA